jgi:hypothetical protein
MKYIISAILYIVMIQINSIWDVLSSFVLVCIYYGIYAGFDGDFEVIISYFMTMTVEKNVKRMTASLNPTIFKRPDSAMNCTLLNSGGFAGDRGGFPSGHMAITSYFMNYLYFKNKDYSTKAKLYYNTPIILMATARYMKGCHNIPQIIAGYLLGYGVAYWGDHVKRKYGKTSLFDLKDKTK